MGCAHSSDASSAAGGHRTPPSPATKRRRSTRRDLNASTRSRKQHDPTLSISNNALAASGISQQCDLESQSSAVGDTNMPVVMRHNPMLFGSKRPSAVTSGASSLPIVAATAGQHPHGVSSSFPLSADGDDDMQNALGESGNADALQLGSCAAISLPAAVLPVDGPPPRPQGGNAVPKPPMSPPPGSRARSIKSTPSDRQLAPTLLRSVPQQVDTADVTVYTASLNWSGENPLSVASLGQRRAYDDDDFDFSVEVEKVKSKDGRRSNFVVVQPSEPSPPTSAEAQPTTAPGQEAAASPTSAAIAAGDDDDDDAEDRRSFPPTGSTSRCATRTVSDNDGFPGTPLHLQDGAAAAGTHASDDDENGVAPSSSRNPPTKPTAAPAPPELRDDPWLRAALDASPETAFVAVAASHY